MFKSADEYERTVCHLLESVLGGKIEYSELENITIDELDFMDAWDFITDCQFVVGISNNKSAQTPSEKLVIEDKPRLSYGGLSFLRTIKNSSFLH